jgi:hypothetical protein
MARVQEIRSLRAPAEGFGIKFTSPQGWRTLYCSQVVPVPCLPSSRRSLVKTLYKMNREHCSRRTETGRKHSEKRGSSESSRFHALFYKQFLHSGPSHPLNMYASFLPLSPHNLSSFPVQYNKLKSQTKEIDLDNQSVVYNASIMLSNSNRDLILHSCPINASVS